MELLEERVILVTGAGRGIGKGICRAIAEAGGRVVATDLDGDSAAVTASEIDPGGRRARGFALDVTDEAEFAAAVERALATFERLDGLVNNAGVLTMAPALDERPEDWRRQLEINVLAVATGCRLVARRMKERQGGAIVNVASNAGKVGYPNMAAYNASKAAVINLTRSLAAEWAPLRINVNAVCPGGVDTPMLSEVAAWLGTTLEEDPSELRSAMVPAQMGRHIRPIEVGRVVAFLLSPHAEIIRGQAINVDGGDTPY